MKIKKYVARNTPEALQQVREDLGDGAVILNTRQIRRNSRFNLSDEARVEVTAAFEETPPRATTSPSPPERPRRGAPLAAQRYAAQSLGGPASPEQSSASAADALAEALPDSLPESRREPMVGYGSGAETRPVAPRPSEGPAQRRAERSAGFPEPAASAPEAAAGPPQPDMQEVSRELRRLQETVARLEQRAPAAVALPPTLRRLEDRMRTMAFSEELAGRVVQQLFHDLDGAALEDRQRVGESASALLAEAMPGSRDIIKIGRRRRVIGFVGASGSGKTTAAAKIAAGFAMKRRDRIALITADDKRVGALDQARAFAEIIGVPLEVAYDRDEIGAVLASYETAQLVLVDTPGCGPHDRQAWDQQRLLLEAAGVDEVQVVIDALTSYDHMLDVIEATEVFPTRRLLFTKMDEVVRSGAVVSAAVRSQIPLSYLVAGPAVPGGIEAADAARLVGQVMGASGPPTTDREG